MIIFNSLIDKTGHWLTKQVTDLWTNQPINQPTNCSQLIDQLTNQLTNRPTDQPTNQLTNRPTDRPTWLVSDGLTIHTCHRASFSSWTRYALTNVAYMETKLYGQNCDKHIDGSVVFDDTIVRPVSRPTLFFSADPIIFSMWLTMQPYFLQVVVGCSYRVPKWRLLSLTIITEPNCLHSSIGNTHL
jgi:hypothetical protein